MTTRRIVSLFILSVGILAAIFLTVVYIGWGPSRGIVVSPASTFITEPLTPAGDVDYPAALLAKMRAGVTPEENAAIPFLEAVWPAGFDSAEQGLICQELGMPRPTAAGFVDWDQSPQSAQFGQQGGDVDGSYQAAQLAPWGRDDFPLLADWLDAQSPHLDHLQQMTTRPKCYLPSPSLLSEPDPLLRAQNYPHLLAALDAARALSARAMLAISEERGDDAWRDIEACFASSRIPSPHGDVVELLVAFSTERLAQQAASTLASSEFCHEDLLRQMADKIGELPLESRLRQAFDAGASFTALQAAQRIGQVRDGQLLDEAYETESTLFANFEWIPFDRNAMSQEINRCLELHRVAHAISDPVQRIKQAEASDEDQRQVTTNMSADIKSSAGGYDQQKRGTSVGQALSALLVESIGRLTLMELEKQQRIRLLQVSIALERYRRANQTYPETLEEITDFLPAEKLKDPYVDANYRYERRDSGYLLYSIFVDQEDDGGTDPYTDVIEGEYSQFADPPPIEEADVVTRIPLRPLQPQP